MQLQSLVRLESSVHSMLSATVAKYYSVTCGSNQIAA